MKFDLPLTEDPIGFETGELVACPRCRKQNGPDRTACLYCGETLPITARNSDKAVLQLRKLEAWEPAFNLIVRSNSEIEDAEVSAAAKLIGIDKNVLTSVLNAPPPMPLARIESEEVTNQALARLSDLGFVLTTIADADLLIERPPVRLRKIAVEGDQLVLTNFNSEGLSKIAKSDVRLIVTGRIVQTRRDEVTSRKKGKTKVLDEMETGSELRLIDLYTSNDIIGLRIQTSGFDFSCLGDEKSMLAAENIGKLAAFLQRHCPKAALADEYDSVRSALDAVWEPESRKDIQGIQLHSVGKHKFGAIHTSSNLSQFTKYSRMRLLI